MKLLDLPFVYEVREEYIALRDELQRKKAVKALMKEYRDELEDVDDSAYFWLGIASGQDELGELTEEYRQNALSALSMLGEDAPPFDEGELDFLNNAGAKKKKPKNEYINWKPGDVYLYDLSGPYAEEAHIDDCSLLLYVIDYYKISSLGKWPRLYLLLNLGKEAPSTKDDLKNCGFFELDRTFSKCGKIAYRKVYTCKNEAEFEGFNAKLKYVGNFPSLSSPPNEAEMDDAPTYLWAEHIDRDVCRAFMKGDIYYFSEDQ